MSQNINQQQEAVPHPVTAYPAVDEANRPSSYVVIAPPPVPMGYPTKDDDASSLGNPQQVVTMPRGDGFWKGCCAGLCCCCALECCL